MRKKIFFLIIILSVIFPLSSFAVETENKVDTWYYIESTFKTKHVFKTKESCEEDRLNYLKQVVKDSTTEVDYLKGTKKESVAECILEKVSGNPIVETKRVVVVDTLDNKPKTDSTKYRLLAPFAGFTEAPETVGDYLNKIFILAIGLCGAIAVVMLIIAGIQYMGESFSGKASAKGRITNALFGLVIALGAYALLNTLDPRLLGKEGVSIKAVSLDIDPETEESPLAEYYASGSKNLCPEGFIDVLNEGRSPSKINVCKSIAQDLTKLLTKAKTENIALSGFGTRSTERQKALRIQNGCPDDKTPSSSCTPPTARPGHSMHESGQAIDFNCGGKSITKKDNVCYVWLTKNAGSFLKNLKSEPWHWSKDGN